MHPEGVISIVYWEDPETESPGKRLLRRLRRAWEELRRRARRVVQGPFRDSFD
ncbi:MAG: hypothetical protein Q8W44_05790 [Candidatus Palauibacterales bacterium]|nr:hypothetical protein [Candidatus Palauibacterales bacterium]